jgi:hypothetical protein
LAYNCEPQVHTTSRRTERTRPEGPGCWLLGVAQFSKKSESEIQESFQNDKPEIRFAAAYVDNAHSHLWAAFEYRYFNANGWLQGKADICARANNSHAWLELK